MDPVSDVLVRSLGDAILVEGCLQIGSDLDTKALNDLIFEKTIGPITPAHEAPLKMASAKTLLITLKCHHTVEDAALGLFGSGLHR
jgi:hypothetical protein